MRPLLTDPNAQITLFGYSQGGAVVSQELYNLADLPQSEKDQIQVVTIGNIDNPQGLWARLSFLPTIAILNAFGPLLPTDIGIKSTNYAFEYDPVGDASVYLPNPLALLNALAAFEYVHGYYLVPNSNDPHRHHPAVRVHRRDAGGGHFEPHQHLDLSGRDVHTIPTRGICRSSTSVMRPARLDW